VTHNTPPWIIVDASKCIDQKCPPVAFGEDGGLTYRFMMDKMLPQLRKFCEVDPESAVPDSRYLWTH